MNWNNLPVPSWKWYPKYLSDTYPTDSVRKKVSEILSHPSLKWSCDDVLWYCILWDINPQNLSREEFEKIAWCYHAGIETVFHRLPNIPTGLPNNSQLGFGIYTSSQVGVSSYVGKKQTNLYGNTFETTYHRLVPFWAKIYDFRKKDNPLQCGRISAEFLQDFFVFLKKYFISLEENLSNPDVVYGSEDEKHYQHELYKTLKTYFASSAFRECISHPSQVEEGDLFSFTSTPAHFPARRLLGAFFMSLGIDGIMMHRSTPILCFFNPDKIGTYETWNQCEGRRDKSVPETQEDIEKKKSFPDSTKENRELREVLFAEPFSPERLIDFLSSLYPWHYERKVGVSEGYTLREHTLMVLRRFEKYFVQDMRDLFRWKHVDQYDMRLFLAMHDFAKPFQKEGHWEKSLQALEGFTSFISKPLAEEFYRLLLDDPIGKYLQEKISKEEAQKMIEKMYNTQATRTGTTESNLSLQEFITLLFVYYMSDASAYAKNAGGKTSLDFLFAFDEEKRKCTFSPHIQSQIDMLGFWDFLKHLLL